MCVCVGAYMYVTPLCPLGSHAMAAALSAEFRRRVLIAELKKSRAPRTVSEFAVGKFPTLLCLREGEAPLRFEKEPTYGRLSTFVGKCALRKPVLKKPAAARPEQAATEKTEL